MKPSAAFRLILASAAVWLAGAYASSAHALQGTPNEGAWLGAYIQSFTPALRDHFPNGPETGGVLITRLTADSPAEKAGIQTGDILLELGDSKLESAEHLRQEISRSRPDTDVRVVLQRGEETLTLTVHLEKKPESLPPQTRMQDPTQRQIPWSRWFILDHEGGLGARMSDMNEGLSSYIPGSAGKGVLILEVCADSPADVAGLKPGDVIVAAAGNPVADLGDLRHELRRAETRTADLDLVRRGERSSVTIELRTAEECWKDPGRSFFQVRPGSPSFRLQPDAQDQTEDHFELFELGPEFLNKLGELRSLVPSREEMKKELQELRSQTSQLESNLQSLRDEVEALKKGLTQETTTPEAQ